MADAAAKEGAQGAKRRPDSATGLVSLPSSPSSAFHHISSFTYTSCYCEENVYLLCKRLAEMGVADPQCGDLFVVFVSNEEKMVPLWRQKSSKRENGLVLWDYHVICIQLRRRQGTKVELVWDLDSNLPFPSPLNEYFAEAIQPVLGVSFINNRLYRVVHAPIFLSCFASDRSHMKDPQGNWLSPPPNYEPINAEDGSVNNLDKYIQLRSIDAVTDLSLAHGVFANKYGVVVREAMLEQFFNCINQ